MTNKLEIPLNCLFKACYDVPEIEKEIEKCKLKCFEYNKLSPAEVEAQQKLIKQILGNTGESVIVTAPFWCDYGYNISVGEFFYSNHNLVINDGAAVTFGDYCFIAPNCCFTTAEHAIDAQQRMDGYEVAKPITVGNNVWIGAGSTILAGVTIGDNAVIGAGSVVTKDIPANVVAVGVPCKVLRPITEADKTRYPLYHGPLKRNGE